MKHACINIYTNSADVGCNELQRHYNHIAFLSNAVITHYCTKLSDCIRVTIIFLLSLQRFFSYLHAGQDKNPERL